MERPMNYIPLADVKEYLSDCFDIHLGVDYVQLNAIPKLPVKPNRPILSNNANSSEVLVYAKHLEIYESEMKVYDFLKLEVKTETTLVYDTLVDWLKDLAGLNQIPVGYRTKVWDLAWRERHSDGYVDVYYFLESLCDIFND